MSNIRKTHPGYYGVCMALAVFWYVGIGIGLTVFQSHYIHSLTYQFVSRYIPLTAWGVLYLALGTLLAVCVNIKKIPHHYVRLLCSIGISVTSFWLMSFIITAFIHHGVSYIFIPPFATVILIEYRAIVESEQNPAMQRLGNDT